MCLHYTATVHHRAINVIVPYLFLFQVTSVAYVEAVAEVERRWKEQAALVNELKDKKEHKEVVAAAVNRLLEIKDSIMSVHSSLVKLM